METRQTALVDEHPRGEYCRMKPDTGFLLEKAEQAIGAAESLLRDGYREWISQAREFLMKAREFLASQQT